MENSALRTVTRILFGTKSGAAASCSSVLLAFCAWQPALAGEAKDLFYQQLNTPTQAQAVNTGMSYWIELRRAGKLLKVDSRYKFKTGDRIRFHVTPNIDGHAHIVMIGGSSGAKLVLFPVAGRDPSNAVKRGKEYVFPPATFIVFDATRGIERVRIAISRKNIASTAFLSNTPPSQLAMATISSNPAVDPAAGNGQLMVGFPEENKQASAPAPVEAAAPAATGSDAIPNEMEEEEEDDGLSKDLFREDSAPRRKKRRRPLVASGAAPVRPNVAHVAQTPGRRPPVKRPPAATAVAAAPTPPPVTIVVNSNPSEDLYADIALEHN